MTDDDLVRLATRYFTALDRRDSDAIADTLADSCLTYSGPDAPPPKSNANVFSMREGKITRISVYMAGANSIKP